MTTIDPRDPFGDLHDEGYLARYAGPEAGANAMVFCGGREQRSLDGDWHFTLDPFDEALRQNWCAQPPQPARDWITPRNYDDGAWQTIAVPSCWNLARPEWRHYEGAALYTREFDHATVPGERTILRIGAASYAARVFLDGALVATHRGGSTPFCVELTAHLAPGRHRLQIHVDNRRERDRVPMGHIDWFNYGGLHRSVSLLRLPPVFIRDFGVALVPGSDGRRIAIDVELSDAVDGLAEVTIAGLVARAVLPVHHGRGGIELDARPERWSPESPRRYDVAARFGDDAVRDTVGFREIAVRGTELLLNGRPLWLKGVCVHEDDEVRGRTTDDADLRRRFADAKALGCNALRLAHYPHDERTAAIADEVGMLLWEEIPVYWAIDFANPRTFADAENQLLELIRRDRNRASVIVWGIGNENADTDARYGFMRALAAAARRADPTRLVSAACLINRERFRIEDRLAEHLDLIGINEYFGWYEPSLDGLARLLANSAPDRPVVISETGADAQAGHRGGERELFTEDCQAAILRDQAAILDGVPWIRGLFPWLLYDYRTERRQTAFQRGHSRKGLIAEDKVTRKLAFDALARYYAGKKP